MNRILVHHIAALLLITQSIAANAQSLPERLENLLNMPLLRHSEAGISVYDLTDRKVIFTHNDKKTCRPASTEKVITAVSALWKLGTDYQVSTQLLYDGNITDGTLHGNLYIKGGLQKPAALLSCPKSHTTLHRRPRPESKRMQKPMHSRKNKGKSRGVMKKRLRNIGLSKKCLTFAFELKR